MKFMILAFNPEMIRPDELAILSRAILDRWGCIVYSIAHYDRNSEPVYCVQLIDTENK